ncbi:MAG: flagellar basal body rod protein FlgB [Betaproteobacteria bacterium]|nr:flagellar basal body rod protein FlgB [Betaproteobacteria bacterium]MDE2131211.1 flagellar basal body rod protein FlgB [Betaproteobacteria bacterium]MDE2211209.1 flagellar basal body rod protein FlgB [Betaproteobacteria bacterium]MDE2353843.1 flagellar basal body rod protein FlgB [Betaproteobacteria bacterium]MDE2624200.1 flagellar basal body rod protein FlgB [Betaproteobacteria bacterium]
MTSRIDQALQFQQTALRLREARQELIASNIANADTPKYQARDIDFASALQNALSGQTQAVPMTTGASQHLGGSSSASVQGAPLLYRSVVQPSADGNTVDMNVERAQFAENTIRHEASLKFVSQQIKDILTVLQG